MRQNQTFTAFRTADILTLRPSKPVQEGASLRHPDATWRLYEPDADNCDARHDISYAGPAVPPWTRILSRRAGENRLTPQTADPVFVAPA